MNAITRHLLTVPPNLAEPLRTAHRSPDASEFDLGELDLPEVADPTPERLARIAQLLGLRPDLWQDKVRFDPEIRHFARLGYTATYEAWLLTWLPGQSTGLHDHGVSIGAFTVVGGLLRERAVLRPGGGRVATSERHLSAGSVRAVEPGHVHEVSAPVTPAVSVHVYSPALTVMTQYEIAGGRLAPGASPVTPPPG